MLQRVDDEATWRGIRLLYIGSAVLFLATIVLGIANVFSPAPIPRAQLLAHLHSGTIGWITLSVIATALWLFLGGRQTTSGERDMTLLLSGLAPLVVAGYVAAFGLFFSDHGPAWMLPLFGIPSGLLIIASMLFITTRVPLQATLTTPHLLMLGALIVASLGATMGILVGLSYNGWFAFPTAGDGVGAHAGPMDMYLALAFAAMIEMAVVPEPRPHARGGRWQAGLGIGGAFVISISLMVGIEAGPPIGLLTFLAAFVIYMVRIGAHALRSIEHHPGTWWGAASLPLYVLLFVYLVFGYFIPGKELPHDLIIAFVHVTFVGMATNLVFVMQSRAAGGPSTWEIRGVWIMNLGLLAFVAGEFLADRPDGALIMAAGALVAWWQIMSRQVRGMRAPTPA